MTKLKSLLIITPLTFFCLSTIPALTGILDMAFWFFTNKGVTNIEWNELRIMIAVWSPLLTALVFSAILATIV